MKNIEEKDLDTSQINQTQFSFEEPMREKAQTSFVDKKVEEINTTKKDKKFSMIFLFAGIGLVLVVLGLATMLIPRRNVAQLANPDTNTEVEGKPVQRDAILVRLDNAKMELRNADPSKQDLVFPPVNMNIRLDDEK